MQARIKLLFIVMVDGVDSVLMALTSSDQATILDLRAVKELGPGSGCPIAEMLTFSHILYNA